MSGKRRTTKETGANVCDPRLVKPFSNGPAVNADRDKLRESEERFRAIFDQAGVGIVISNSNSRIHDCNIAFLELLGYSKEDLLLKSFADVTHPDDVGKNLDLFRQIVAGEIDRYQMEKRYIRRDGRAIWCKLTVSAIRENDGTFKYSMAVIEDISERKRAEEAFQENNDELQAVSRILRESEHNLAEAQRLAHVGSWDWNVKTGEMCRSEEFYRILGLVPPSHKPTQFSFISCVHPDDFEMVKKAFNDAISEGKSHDFECRIVLPDGSVRIVHEKGEVVEFDESGKPLRLLGTFHDITERKRAEEALRESEKKFSVLAETSPAAILVYQGKKNLYANHAAELISGYTREELLSMDYFDLIHPDHLELIKNRAFALSEGKQVPQRYDVKVITKNGEEKWIGISAGFTDYMGSPAGIITAIDITERKRVEEELQESVEKFRALADSSPVSISLLQDDHIVYTNDASVASMGYSREEWLKMKYWEIVHPDFRELAKERMREILSGDSSHQRNVYKLVRNDGEERWVLCTGARLTYLGKPAVVVTTVDITERKMAEEALKAEKAQARLYLDLMGHDINNMHQIALGYLELARDAQACGGQTEFLDKSVEVLQRSTRLISNVRKLQKLRDGMFQSEIVDLTKVLRDVHREFGAIPNKTITLNTNGCEYCPVQANELLYDVFSNLVDNAIKHTGNRAGVVIDLDIVKDNGGRYCRVAVEDDGPGIPDDFKVKIFNRALKGTAKAKGMGLGLYLVKSLVDSYGGRIWVEDRIKGDHTKGARFVVMLPATGN